MAEDQWLHERFKALEGWLSAQDRKLGEIHAEARGAHDQARKTNGRVDRAEDRLDHIESNARESRADGHRRRERVWHFGFAVVGAGGAILYEVITKWH
ncbi:MAG: hypothetical protein KGL39_42280 [Patescibacteria group bacterium]|nr:hypothetical protein [Patescibacteria group bacterium]